MLFEQLFPYILFILFLLIVNFASPKGKNATILIAVVIFFFAGFRYDVGWDYESYYKILQSPSTYEFERLELLNRILIQYCHDIGWIDLFFIITSFLTVFFIFQGLKREYKQSVLGFFCYVCLPLFFFQSLTIVRQLLAVSIIFYATIVLVYNFNRRNLLLFLFWYVIAINIHSSTYVCIIIPFLLKINISKKIQIFIFILSFVFRNVIVYVLENFQSLPAVLSTKVNTYVKEGAAAAGFGLIIYVYMLLFFINMFSYDKLVSYNSKLVQYIKLCSIGLILYNLLMPTGIGGARISIFFLIFSILVVPAYTSLVRGKRSQELLHIFICLFLSSLFFMNIFISTAAYKNRITSKDPLLPYKTIFNKKD